MDSVSLLASLGQVAPGVGKLVLGGRRVPIPGGVVETFADGSRCAPPVTDYGIRHEHVQGIVVHTEHGEPRDPPLLTTPAQTSHACELDRYQTTTDREVSWDIFNSAFGVIYQQNDPVRQYTWQAGGVNPRTLGIENEQGPGGGIRPVQLESFVRLIDTLTRSLPVPIQRQIPAVRDARGRLVPDRRVIARFTGAGGSGANFWGIYGHRNITDQRGPGDPGDLFFQALLNAGYEGFDLAAGEDLRVWRERQRVLGVPQTGIPDAPTVAALKRRGFPRGLFVHRPGDGL